MIPPSETGDLLRSPDVSLMVVPEHQRRRIIPVGGEGPIGVLGVRGGKDPGQLGRLG